MKKLSPIFVILCFVLSSCYKEDIPVVPDGSIYFVPFSATPILTADGDTTLKIQLKTDYPTAIKQTTLTANIGKFSNESNTIDVTFDNAGNATAYLKSVVVGQSIISAATTVGAQNINSSPITFTTAYAEHINVNCNALMTNALGEKLVLTMSLSRNRGTVSQGQDLTYKAMDSLGNLKGAFFNRTLSNSDGNTTVEYWLQDSTYTGLIVFKAIALNDTSVYGVNQVYVGED
ncbi:MAG: hypothetical protein IPP64_11945 [Bacteroidetes bacterium]|nr:hypothetical protein [Bacteroidota bacterium]